MGFHAHRGGGDSILSKKLSFHFNLWNDPFLRSIAANRAASSIGQGDENPPAGIGPDSHYFPRCSMTYASGTVFEGNGLGVSRRGWMV